MEKSKKNKKSFDELLEEACEIYVKNEYRESLEKENQNEEDTEEPEA